MQLGVESGHVRNGWKADVEAPGSNYLWQPQRSKVVLTCMTDGKTYEEPTKVRAIKGDVILDGPDGVDVAMTPGAAAETSDRLLEGAAMAQRQRLEGAKDRAD